MAVTQGQAGRLSPSSTRMQPWTRILASSSSESTTAVIHGVLVNGVVAENGQPVEVTGGRVKLEVVMSVNPRAANQDTENGKGG